jgi:hypothetical protein
VVVVEGVLHMDKVHCRPGGELTARDHALVTEGSSISSRSCLHRCACKVTPGSRMFLLCVSGVDKGPPMHHSCLTSKFDKLQT